MLAAREPSAEAFLARLDTLRQTIRTHEDAPDALLTLSTIHSSKGLEYERVYLLDVHDGVLPSRPDAADGTEDERRVYEEDRRLVYVAMTRAKDELTLFEYPDAPSAFIREARGYLPVPVCAKDDFAAIVPENACGLRYRHETRGEGSILAQCEDELLVAFPDGDSLMQAGRMLLERSRAGVHLPSEGMALLPQARALITGAARMGTLTLRLDTVQVEPSGYGSSTREISTKRSYPNLAEQDTQYLPKTITENGKTLTLTDIQWQTDNTANMDGYAVADRYTAVATYSGSATSSYVKGYTVTADYAGTVSRIALNRVRYVAIFEGTPIQPTEPAETPATTSAFRWSYVLIPIGIVAAAGAGVGGALLVKHRKENADEEDTE